MTSADDSNRSIIIVLGRSERQVVEFGVRNLMKKKTSRARKKPIPPSMNTLILGKRKKTQESTIDCINTQL